MTISPSAEDLFCYADRLQHDHPDLTVQMVASTDSTQKQVVPNGVLIADSQLSGVGRRGHHWLSPAGQAISFSYRFKLPVAAAQLSGYQLTAALAVTTCLRHFGCQQQRLLKWPNDLYFDGRKFGGILINLSPTKTANETEIIIGIGLNWRLTDKALATINQPVCNVPLTSKPDRGLFINHLLTGLKQSNQRFCDQGLAPFLTEWSNQDSLIGCSLELHQEQRRILGDYAGLSPRGELQIIKKGQIECFGSGEVRVRPL